MVVGFDSAIVVSLIQEMLSLNDLTMSQWFDWLLVC